jgi:hypothetical protein
MNSEDGISEEGGHDPSYSFKPALLGAPWELHLRPDALEWRVGLRSGRVTYDSIRRLRLSFRPVTMQSYRFLTEIWSDTNPRITIASTSWKSIVEQERQDAAYRTFVAELHRRIASAPARARFQRGSPAIMYWLGAAISAAAALSLAVLALRALYMREWTGAALVLGFMALFAWQIGMFFWRNLPGTYRPDAIPSQVLPRP